MIQRILPSFKDLRFFLYSFATINFTKIKDKLHAQGSVSNVLHETQARKS